MCTKLLALALFLFILPAAKAQSNDEQALLQLANQSRAQFSLPPLTWDTALASAAKAHAAWILRIPGAAEHRYPGEPDLTTRSAQAGAHFGAVCENIASHGTTPEQIAQAWMESPGHRANILNPHVNVAGIAVVQKDGDLYAVEDLAQTVPNATSVELDQQIAKLLRVHNITPVLSRAAHEDALKSCLSNTSISRVPATIIQWDGSDLAQIPENLLQQLPTAKSRPVVIAACPSQRITPGFTTIHVALLIF